MKINFYTGDLPASFKASDIIALDSETMGLNPKRDKLCLVQISNGDEVCHLVKIDLSNEKPHNLIKILRPGAFIPSSLVTKMRGFFFIRFKKYKFT